MSILDLQEEQQPPEVQRLIARMDQIQGQLLEQTPLLHEALADIHKILHQHEELVHLMSDEDIAKLHQAFEKHKGVVLVQKEAKTAKKKISKDELNDPNFKL